MTTWRMSFRVGNRGHPMWKECLQLGVAAITYDPLAEIDLSEYPKGEPKELWAQLEPSQKASLRRVAYEMEPGDVIYVKLGPKIVGKGIVKGPYQFDTKFRLVAPNGVPWAHQVPVEWVHDFPEIKILLGAEPLTVKKLSPDELELLETTVETVKESNTQREALEGEFYEKEAIFRSRNRVLIQAKKANSHYCCEVCGFNFEETYGAIGHEYIVAHHLKPIASGPSRTTLEDIALVCANCHAMIHKKHPPISIEDLRKAITHR
jgi:hypothetical protein